MATTNYPKSYILERIAARRVSIESKRTADTNLVAVNRDTVIEQQQVFLDELKAKVEEKTQSILNAKLSDDPDRNLNLLNSMSSIYLTTRGVPRWDNKITAANTRLRQYDHELDALDHTEAYLKGTPVEEFSLTSLQRLGLMEAIKFNLDDALSPKKS